MKVLSIHAGTAKWGRIDEIQALDKDGKPIPLYSERREPMVAPPALEDVYKWCKSRDASKPVFLDLASFAAPAAQAWDAATRKALYPQYVKHSDVAGFEVGSVAPMGDLVAASVGEIRTLAGSGRPIFVLIDLGGKRSDPNWLDSPRYVRSAVWSALIGGATAVGYTLPRAEAGKKEVPPMNIGDKDLARLNQAVARLAPAILAPAAKAKVEMTIEGAMGHLKATELDGAIYVFAQSIDPAKGDRPTACKASIKVAGLKAGTRIEVVDEDRTITSADGQFTDDFAPLAEHVYKFQP